MPAARCAANDMALFVLEPGGRAAQGRVSEARAEKGGRVMEPLRCWSRWDGRTSRSAADSVFCERAAGHERPCRYAGCSWETGDSATDHGPAGRLTVAHRLLELSWRIDPIAFRLANRSELAEMLRAMAARLLVGADAAAADLQEVLEDARIGDEVAATPSDGVNTSILEAFENTREILRAAAELLRPFAREAAR